MNKIKMLITSILLAATLGNAIAAELGFVSGKYAGVDFNLQEMSRGVWQDSNGSIRNDSFVNMILNGQKSNSKFTEVTGSFGDFDGGVISGTWEGAAWTLTEISEGLWIDSNGKMRDDVHATAVLTLEGSTGSMGNSSVTAVSNEFLNGGHIIGYIGSRIWELIEISEGRWEDNNGNFYGDWAAQQLLNKSTSTGVMGYTDAEVAQKIFDDSLEFSPWLTSEGEFIIGSATEVPPMLIGDLDVDNTINTGGSVIHAGVNISDGDIVYLTTGHEVQYINGELIAVNDIFDNEGKLVFAAGSSAFVPITTYYNIKPEINTVISSTIISMNDTGIAEAWSEGFTGAGITISTVDHSLSTFLGGGSFVSNNGELVNTYGVAKDATILLSSSADINDLDLTADIIYISNDYIDVSGLVTDALIVQDAGFDYGQASRLGSSNDAITNLINSSLVDQVIIVATLNLIDNPDTLTFDEVTGTALNVGIPGYVSSSLTGTLPSRVLGNACGEVAMNRCVVEFNQSNSFNYTDSFSASAMVAGKAALLMQKFSDDSASEIADRIFRTAIDLGETGVDAVYGHGLMNLHAALTRSN